MNDPWRPPPRIGPCALKRRPYGWPPEPARSARSAGSGCFRPLAGLIASGDLNLEGEPGACFMIIELHQPLSHLNGEVAGRISVIASRRRSFDLHVNGGVFAGMTQLGQCPPKSRVAFSIVCLEMPVFCLRCYAQVPPGGVVVETSNLLARDESVSGGGDNGPGVRLHGAAWHRYAAASSVLTGAAPVIWSAHRQRVGHLAAPTSSSQPLYDLASERMAFCRRTGGLCNRTRLT